ncbi:MAG: hypothetical protein M1129_04070 [Candidatus Thermoplasmatota archaeon]|jgi:hypothetical protein|nr:hypothetical protein [Candidatus Thermoplasmatota archaeon]MCL5955033.1 hypothetical protein [Candidatus Thermoplasmatota archaeon]
MEEPQPSLDLLKDFSLQIRKVTHAPMNACNAAAQLLIASAMPHCVFKNEIGDIQTNLSFLWIAPSSTYKTPLRDLLKDIYFELFKGAGYRLKSKFTTEGIMNSLSQFKKQHEDKGENLPYWALILRDEVSNLAKESKSGRSSNIWEFLSEAFDGYISPYDTVRGGTQEYPDTLFNIWMSGTAVFYEHLRDDFWDQGFAFRTLFIKPEKNPYLKPESTFKRQYAIENICQELKGLLEIKRAIATIEWNTEYQEYVKEIRDKLEIEADLFDTPNRLPIDIAAIKKYPELVVKLSMVRCASRQGWEVKDGIKHLLLTDDDLHAAMLDLGEYQNNCIAAYNTYQVKKEAPMKVERNIQERKNILNAIRNIETRYELQTEMDEKTEEFVITSVNVSDKGEWVRKSDVMRKTGYSKRTMDGLIETMEDALEIEAKQVEVSFSRRPILMIRERRSKD